MRVATTVWLLTVLAPAVPAREESPFMVQALAIGHNLHGASVVRDPDAGRLDLYYSGRTSSSEAHASIYRRTSTDAWNFTAPTTVWQHNSSTVPGENGTKHALDPTVIRVFNHVFGTYFYVMYYTRLDPNTGSIDIWAVSSPDGSSWGAAGLVIPGGKEPCVVDIDGNDFWIYYRSTEEFFFRQRITGIFNIAGPPASLICDGGLCFVADPAIAKLPDGTWKMVSTGPHPNNINRSALHEWLSLDGITWTAGTQPLVSTSPSLPPCSDLYHVTSPAIDLVGSGQTLLFMSMGPDVSCHGEERYRIDEWWLDSSCVEGGLRFAHPFPGSAGFTNVSRILGGTPNGLVFLSLSFALQPVPIPGCNGTTLLLQPTPIVAPVPMSPGGNLVLTHAVSPSIAGLKVGMQLFDSVATPGCSVGRVSNPLVVEY